MLKKKIKKLRIITYIEGKHDFSKSIFPFFQDTVHSYASSTQIF